MSGRRHITWAVHHYAAMTHSNSLTPVKVSWTPSWLPHWLKVMQSTDTQLSAVHQTRFIKVRYWVFLTTTGATKIQALHCVLNVGQMLLTTDGHARHWDNALQTSSCGLPFHGEVLSMLWKNNAARLSFQDGYPAKDQPYSCKKVFCDLSKLAE